MPSSPTSDDTFVAVLIVDDALLLAVLSGLAPDDVHAAADRNEAFATGF